MFSLQDLCREHPVIFTLWLIVQCFFVCLFLVNVDFISFHHAIFEFVIVGIYIVLMMFITRDW
jgi:hypothetical protein